MRLLLRARSVQRNQSRGELHLGIVSAQPKCHFYLRVAVHAICWIFRTLSKPLLVRLSKIASVKNRQRIRVSRTRGRLGSRCQFKQQLLGRRWILACVERRSPQRFHVYESCFGTAVENRDGVVRQV